MPNPEKVDELRDSAQQLAKQALETAELGLRFVRTQFDATSTGLPLGAVPENLQDTAFTVESKAKEMFNLATHFMSELNEKWQPRPGTPAASGAGESRPKAEKIDIDAE